MSGSLVGTCSLEADDSKNREVTDFNLMRQFVVVENWNLMENDQKVLRVLGNEDVMIVYYGFLFSCELKKRIDHAEDVYSEFR